jgi:energy-converting hydrogenase Eha subunit A
VVQRVQEVGAAVLANLQSASAAVACPTIQEAKAKKFEYIPSAYFPVSPVWRKNSSTDCLTHGIRCFLNEMRAC